MSAESQSLAVDLTNVSFGYHPTKSVLQIPELKIARGEKVFIHGPSGSGKTTLLGLLTGILTAKSGSVSILGTNFSELSSTKRDLFRGEHIGYIFQMFNLIPYLSVLENIMLPCSMHSGRRARLRGQDLSEVSFTLADHLGIRHLLQEPVTSLSVGQQQRVAAARSLIGDPELIVADEPTSALDHDQREAFLQILFKESERIGATVLFVSHDRSLMPLFSRSVALGDINKASKVHAP